MSASDEKPLSANIRPGGEPPDLARYERSGGYQGLRKALAMAPRAIMEMVKSARLRGRGGAGFPTADKWAFLPPRDNTRRPIYLVINADEMEPGTMKDRWLMEGDPHQLIEGAITAGRAIDADKIYIFLRWAYWRSESRLRKAIAEARSAGYIGKNILGSDYSVDVGVHMSAGRYMCGEETGLLNALEGRRANPRSKPPHPTTCGLWGKPTIVNNVETICCVHHIVLRGAEWFRSLSRTQDGGTKIYGASGRVKNPGLWELPMGSTMAEVMDRAGGMKDGLAMRGVLPGGASTSFMLPRHADVPLDFTAPAEAGSRLGTGTMIVMDDKTCPVSLLHGLQTFFARESCGWCTPCREGLPWVARTLAAIEAGQGRAEDLDILEHHVRGLGPGNTFCALAPGAMEPLGSALRHFRADFEEHISTGRCRYGEKEAISGQRSAHKTLIAQKPAHCNGPGTSSPTLTAER
jgi:NADH-quinone oxidoreductase subunit F